MLESETLIGERLALLSKYLKDYHGLNKPFRGRIPIGRLDPGPSSEDVKKAINFGMHELTKAHDKFEILRIAIRILFKIGRRNRDPKYICSELVYEAFRKADVWFKFKQRSISLDEILQDPRVNQNYRIH